MARDRETGVEGERDAAVRYFQGRVTPFTQDELCKLLGTTRFTLLRWRADGRLKCFKAGNVLRYHVEDVFRFLMQQTA